VVLKGILRGEWGFSGYVVSDCGAINDIYERHKVVQTAAAAAALGVKKGTDLECGNVYANLVDAVRQGLITEQAIDTAVKRLFLARMRLGVFDPPERVRWAQIPISVLDRPAHRALARQVARESIVLLKNAGSVLPLRKDIGTIAVIGPNCDDRRMLLGNYEGAPADSITPLRGIREAVSRGTRVLYARGSDWGVPGDSGLAEAAGSAVADVLFGDYNPGGRLPVTFYKSVNDLPAFDDYRMAGRTYRFFKGTPLYPFGYGLSYTTFAYKNLRTSATTLRAADTAVIWVDVTNTGRRTGDEVAQLYVRHLGSRVERPTEALRAFRRVTLNRGETHTVAFSLPASSLAS